LVIDNKQAAFIVKTWAFNVIGENIFGGEIFGLMQACKILRMNTAHTGYKKTGKKELHKGFDRPIYLMINIIS
jgi:hypothetical protein